MVKENVEINLDKMGDIQKDVIHFERLIGDLIGILSKSISFCIHSGESINELVKQSVRNCEGMNDKTGDEKPIIIQESSYVHENDATMNNNDNGIDYIQFKNGGPLYSLPKRITNSLVGSFIYEASQEDQRSIDSTIYLDYPYDETVAPLLFDSLMNKKISIDMLSLSDQIDLFKMFGYCGLPIPEEFVKYPYRFRKNHIMKPYKEDDDVILYINEKKDDRLRDYLKKNGLWNYIINEYDDGYVDYDEENNEIFIQMNYKYIDHINEYIQYNCIYISEEETKNINRDLLENEMYSLFGDEVKEKIKEALTPCLYFPYTRILTNKSMEIPLVNWLGKEKQWKLLFRASEYEYKASEFHKYCDTKCPTVSIIKHKGHDNKINIFGGYTTQYWESRSENWWKFDSGSFLFTLSNEYDIPPTKYDILDPYNALYCNKNRGPDFMDICISDDCHNNNDSYVNEKTTVYAHSLTPQFRSLFVNTAGPQETNYFTVDEYEVYELIPDPHLYLPNSILINEKMGNELSKWFEGNKKWELLYRCSDENRSVKKWHEKCDEKESLVIIQGKDEYGQSYIFGGYTSVGWGKNHRDMENPLRGGTGFRADSKAFLFSLTNPHGHNYTKININPEYTNSALISNDSTSELVFCGGIYLKSQIDKDQFTNGNNEFLCDESPVYISPYPELGNSFFANNNKPDKKNEFDLIDFEVFTSQ
ncbi:hypothetical protein WA158_000743 [Blastocystis sp. Blastoise]